MIEHQGITHGPVHRTTYTINWKVNCVDKGDYDLEHRWTEHDITTGKLIGVFICPGCDNFQWRRRI